MSSKLKHRRSGDERDCEDGRILSKQQEKTEDSISVDGKSKQRSWKRLGIGKKCVSLFAFFLLCILGQQLIPKTPKLPVLNVDIEVPDAQDWRLIHLVQSRFMQEQGPLETLGMARLKLFQTFCLPSMVQQSSQEFFWIIKTDPQFTTTTVFQQLVESVKSHPNIYLVASNTNFVFGSAGREGSWRDGKEATDLLESKIYTGDIAKLKAAMALRHERPVLETRLDADDGLTKSYIEYIQDEALKRFRPSDKDVAPKWLYWCSRRHVEWHSDTDGSLSNEQEANLGNPEVGYMNIIQHDKLCVTPGITVGYNTVVDKNKKDIEVPQYDHDVLYKNLHESMSCYDDTSDIVVRKDDEKDDEVQTTFPCLELIEDFLFCAIRSRTWTSAGMDKIDLPGSDGGFQDKEFTDRLWAIATRTFGVTETNVKDTQKFLIRNKKAIAQENLLGQCSTGHSCKDSAKAKLMDIIGKE